jgi:hypothetical protein
MQGEARTGMDHLCDLGSEAALGCPFLGVRVVCFHDRGDVGPREESEQLEVLFDVCILDFDEILRVECVSGYEPHAR